MKEWKKKGSPEKREREKKKRKGLCRLYLFPSLGFGLDDLDRLPLLLGLLLLLLFTISGLLLRLLLLPDDSDLLPNSLFPCLSSSSPNLLRYLSRLFIASFSPSFSSSSPLCLKYLSLRRILIAMSLNSASLSCRSCSAFSSLSFSAFLSALTIVIN